MNGLADTNTPIDDVENLEYQPEVNVFLSQSQVAGNYSKYPTITIEEVKTFLKDEATTKKVKSSTQSNRSSKVMKFKFLDAKDSESGTPELITATEKTENDAISKIKVPSVSTEAKELGNKSEYKSEIPKPITAVEQREVKSDSEVEIPKATMAAEDMTSNQDRPNCKTTQYQRGVNLSLSKSLVPTNYSKYPRISVYPKSEGSPVRRKKTPKTLVNSSKISARDLRSRISDMSPRQITNLLKLLEVEKLQSIQNCLSKVLEKKNREIIATKLAQIEKLKQEIQGL